MSDCKANSKGVMCASLEKAPDSSIYLWRGWKVAKVKGTGLQKYQAREVNQGVSFRGATLADIRVKLMLVNDEVEAGNVPSGCKKTSERVNRDRVARPMKEKLESATSATRVTLEYQITQGNEAQKEFVARASVRMDSALEWAEKLLRRYRIGWYCQRLQEYSDEELSTRVLGFREELANKLLNNYISDNSTGVFFNACSSVEREAVSAMVQLLDGILAVYSFEGAPVGE